MHSEVEQALEGGQPAPLAEVPVETYSDEELFGSELDVASNPRERYKLPLTQARKDALTGYYSIGEGGSHWYTEMYSDFKSIFMDEENARMFIRLLGVTSPTNQVETNVHYAMKAYALWILGGKTDRLITSYAEGAAQGVPESKFRGFLGTHAKNIKKVISCDETVKGMEGCRDLQDKLSKKKSPKVSAFIAAMFGDVESVVVDRWMIRACHLTPQDSGKASVTLIDGVELEGRAELAEGGVFFYLPNEHAEAALWVPKDKELSLFSYRLGDKIQKGTRDFFIPNKYIKKPLYENLKFVEKKISYGQYHVIAEAIATVAHELGVPPRDFQAGVWTGIKIADDPDGLENYVVYYRKHYGSDPPSMELLEEIASRAKYVREKREAVLPGFEEAAGGNPPEIDDRNDVDMILEDAASMLQ